MNSGPMTGKHVLVVDDEPDYAALLRSILVKAGFTVATAYSAEDAMAEVHHRKPDVIALDIGMPRKSGVHFYHTLKKADAFQDVPVVVVTGLTGDREMENLIHSLLEPDNLPHPQAYLEKPVEPAHLLKTLREAIVSGAAVNC